MNKVLVREYFPGFVDCGNRDEVIVYRPEDALCVPWVIEKCKRSGVVPLIQGDLINGSGAYIKGGGGFIIAFLFSQDGKTYWKDKQI